MKMYYYLNTRKVTNKNQTFSTRSAGVRLYLVIGLILLSATFSFDAHAGGWKHLRKLTWIVMRHGDSENLLFAIRNSRRESKPMHLTQKGVAQVKYSGQQLLDQGFTPDRIIKVYSSPLTRTRETAALVWDTLRNGKPNNSEITHESLLDLPRKILDFSQFSKLDHLTKSSFLVDRKFVTSDHLIERDFEDCENHSFTETKGCKLHGRQFGEPDSSIALRMKAFREEVEEELANNLETDSKNGDKTRDPVVLVVTHEINTKLLLDDLGTPSDKLPPAGFGIASTTLRKKTPHSDCESKRATPELPVLPDLNFRHFDKR